METNQLCIISFIHRIYSYVQCTRSLHDLLQKMRTKKSAVGSSAVRGIDGVKARNVLPFANEIKYVISVNLNTYFLFLVKT